MFSENLKFQGAGDWWYLPDDMWIQVWANPLTPKCERHHDLRFVEEYGDFRYEQSALDVLRGEIGMETVIIDKGVAEQKKGPRFSKKKSAYGKLSKKERLQGFLMAVVPFVGFLLFPRLFRLQCRYTSVFSI